MRTVTVAAVLLLLGSLGAVAVVSFTAASDGSLSEKWVSDTGVDARANHHAVAVTADGVYAPVSAGGQSDACALFALNAADGETRWRYPIPAQNCTVHSVADPAVADYDADGTREVLVATTEAELAAFRPASGQKEFTHALSDYGYTRPVVADLAPAEGRETVVVDATGSVVALAPNGTELWRTEGEGYTFAQPYVRDVDGDGDPELLLGGPAANVTVYAGDGSVEWRRHVGTERSITWQTVGQADDDPQLEAVVATTGGAVVAVDGRTGSEEWRVDVGTTAAVRAFGDGDGDGANEVYAVGGDGVLRSLDAASGDVEWRTDLAADAVQMTPPPTLGDVSGDGQPELVVAGNDGTVSVVDPNGGTLLATYERAVPLYTHPTLEDTDGDAAEEIFVVYADGRVVALDYDAKGRR